jgi:3'-phosphoadenosine 5'-phosphosulfate sulfotransferase (PAPS reductase)/FAD synthetase
MRRSRGRAVEKGRSLEKRQTLAVYLGKKCSPIQSLHMKRIVTVGCLSCTLVSSPQRNVTLTYLQDSSSSSADPSDKGRAEN